MKRLIITEEEKKHILSLHQNLNIKGILQEGLDRSGKIYTTENDQRIYYGTNTSYDYVDIKKGTKFTKTTGGATAFGGGLVFSCSRVGTVKFENGSGNKHFTYKKKTYWANALQKRLISVFCTTSTVGNLNIGCLKGNCQSGYGEKRYEGLGLYKGQFQGGKPNGYGVLTDESTQDSYPSQNEFGLIFTPEIHYVYTGTWKNGKLNGPTKVTGTSGQYFKQYNGNMTNSKPNGYGKYEYQDGGFFWGQFQNGGTTDQTYYQNENGCKFKGKGNYNNGDSVFDLSGYDHFDLDDMKCTSGEWTDLEKVKKQTPVGSNPNNPEVGNNPSNEVKDPSGNIISGCTQYNDCSSKDGSTTKFVKCDTCSEISRLQACLKDANGNMLKPDSKWGKNTEAALNLLNYNGTDGITSEIITTICTNFNQPQV